MNEWLLKVYEWNHQRVAIVTKLGAVTEIRVNTFTCGGVSHTTTCNVSGN